MDLQDMMLCSLLDIRVVEEPICPIFSIVDGGSRSLRNVGIIIVKAKQYHMSKVWSSFGQLLIVPC